MPRRPLIAVAVAAVAVLAAGCGTSACQELGEKLCRCQPGMSEDACKGQVQEQLNQLGVDSAGFDGMLDHVEAGTPVRYEDFCRARLDACNQSYAAARATDFCEFLLTEDGKNQCGLTPANPPPQ